MNALAQGKAALAEAGKPKVGECWQSSFKDVDGFANWGGRPPVKCSGPHQLYTFAVAALMATHKGNLFDAKGFAHQAIEDDAYDTCDGAENTELSSVDDTVARIYVLPILPEEQQWNAGARWVRCDVGVLAVGSSVAHPALESLPASEALYTQLRDAPAQFDFCVSDPGGLGAGGPKGSNALYADCEKDPEWKLHDYQVIVTGDGSAFPTPEQMRAQYALSCEHDYADATHVTYAYYPSKSDWDSGYQELECWIGRE